MKFNDGNEFLISKTHSIPCLVSLQVILSVLYRFLSDFDVFPEFRVDRFCYASSTIAHD